MRGSYLYKNNAATSSPSGLIKWGEMGECNRINIIFVDLIQRLKIESNIWEFFFFQIYVEMSVELVNIVNFKDIFLYIALTIFIIKFF